MSCSCDMYDELADVFNLTERRARKTHKCCECGCIIEPGVTYVVVDVLFDSEWSTHKACRICMAIRGDLSPCSPMGCLRDDLWECLGFDYVTGREDSRWD